MSILRLRWALTTIEMSVVLKKTKIQNYLGLEQLKYILEAALKLLFKHQNTTT